MRPAVTDVNFDKLKVVFIDWYGTLTSQRFFSKLKAEDPQLFAKIDGKIFDKDSMHWHLAWARGILNQNDVAKIIEEDGIVDHKRMLEIFSENSREQKPDYPEFFEVIGQLRNKGIKVVLATDNWDVFCEYTIPALGLEKHFDAIISSNEVSCLKRDVDGVGRLMFFEEYIKDHGFTYGESVLIDDAQINYEACQKCGMPFRQVNSTAETLEFLRYIEVRCC